MPTVQPRPNVVIVGGGFGGLAAADALARVPVSVTILDRQNHHCFQPLLYQVATAALSPADVAWPIRALMRGHANTRVLMAEVTGIDCAARRVETESFTVPYDYLVLATGVTHSYFGHDEWGRFAPGLKRIEDATAIRRSILLAFERAEITEDAAERARLLTFVVIGGGPTGVEMAGAIAEIAHHALARDFRHINPTSARIVLIEAGPVVLPSFPAALSEYARSALQRMGVEVQTSTRVTGCDARGVSLQDGRLDAATLIWAAGIVASPAAQWLGADHDRAGRVKVGPDLSVPDHPEIFVIGDTAAVPMPDGAMVPGIAPAAKQMGAYVARVIGARVAQARAPGPFVYHHQGDLATIGRRAAVVKLQHLQLSGFIGWVFWSIVHIYFLIGARNRLVVAVTWLWSYLTFQRGARLITAVAASDPDPSQHENGTTSR